MSTTKNGLEIDLDKSFHRRFWKVQRVSWFIWLLIVLAAGAGLLGPGMKGRKTITTADAKLTLVYQPTVHYQSPSELEIRVQPENSKEVRLRLGTDFIGNVSIIEIKPEPAAQEHADTDIIYTFKIADTIQTTRFVIQYEPKRFGKIPIAIRVDEHPPLLATQFIFP